MNCAGLSREFLETELFGHEKGAYTGAVSSKPGLLEVAHRGVVFLDEIGDLDPQVQPKLLKVLEEKRFRRLGEVRDRQVDVQLVAATHQDLPEPDAGEEVPQRPLLPHQHDPPPGAAAARAAGGHPGPGAPAPRRLRERPRDDAACGCPRRPRSDSPRHSWPGNVRELRNVLERALLFCGRDVLGAGDLRFEGPGAAAVPPTPRRRDPPHSRGAREARTSSASSGSSADAWPRPPSASASPAARSTRRSRNSGSPSPAPPEAVRNLERRPSGRETTRLPFEAAISASPGTSRSSG